MTEILSIAVVAFIVSFFQIRRDARLDRDISQLHKKINLAIADQSRYRDATVTGLRGASEALQAHNRILSQHKQDIERLKGKR